MKNKWVVQVENKKSHRENTSLKDLSLPKFRSTLFKYLKNFTKKLKVTISFVKWYISTYIK